MLRRGGTLVCNGLPTGDFPVSIFDTVLNGITIRGSIVGTRLDLQESLDMAAEGKVKATVAAEPLDNINDIFDRMRDGKIEGRIVIDYSMQTGQLIETFSLFRNCLDNYDVWSQIKGRIVFSHMLLMM